MGLYLFWEQAKESTSDKHSFLTPHSSFLIPLSIASPLRRAPFADSGKGGALSLFGSYLSLKQVRVWLIFANIYIDVYLFQNPISTFYGTTKSSNIQGEHIRYTLIPHSSFLIPLSIASPLRCAPFADSGKVDSPSHWACICFGNRRLFD